MSKQNVGFGNVPYFSIGEMRSVGVFQSNSPTTTASGGQIDNYTVIATVRGRLRKQGGNKRDEQGEIVINRFYEFICRYTSLITAIDSDTNITINGVTYRIENWDLIDEIQHYYNFTLSIWK